ncbi:MULTISPECIES: MerR family transcriptional regulator [Pontibacillus]|uniref:MerR family DNA-binding transcriptional regulator n=1 Tax=Pontibacillus chungwhensis TaxID=265426 RepID=A0ABY8V1X4_9BACI|nr:MerR family DNA-binding transcriptional regulator [Pontibacillus chungwhensis]MCD5322153.1 MerR family DNA-binding transcriptional regulator [Pontibacillus sp. HN14]WIF99448.1 MerR family DNA-binding transcriptional regulator [Pontibacillus chungwhensis]
MTTYTISELANTFGVSTRTIRYYEQLGMLEPERTESGQRVYGKKEKTRLVLIFRGKKFGFKLEEIREMVQLFDQDPSGARQLERTIQYGEEKIREVTERIEELTDMRCEMEGMLDQFRRKLHN